MSLDFNPGEWLTANPVPPPRGWPRPNPPWRQTWADAELGRGRNAAVEMVRIVGGRTGRGADVARSLWAWALPGMEAAYAARDADGLRQHASILILAATNLPDALEWFREPSTEDAAPPVPARPRRASRNAAVDELVGNGTGAPALF